MPKSTLDDLSEEFEVEFIKQPWHDIGTDMKLEPYPYQKETIYHIINNPNTLAILPVGAGKTPIAIGTYLELLKKGLTDKPAIICVKASIKYQWTKEVEKFSNLRAKAIDTPSKMKNKFNEQFEDCDLFVLNYETLKNEEVVKKLREKEVETIIVDEVHILGGYKTARSKAVQKFNDLKIKVGLTATPITKNPENLFGIFKLINQDLFKTHKSFSDRFLIYRSYGQVSGGKNLPLLREMISPYTFVKSDKEIAKQMPQLIINQIECEMTPAMKEMNNKIMAELQQVREECEAYEECYNDDKNKLDFDPEFNKYKARIMALQTFAQELVDDPKLLTHGDSQMAKNYAVKDLTSPKLETLLNLLDEIVGNDEKVCIFTRYERMQRLIVNAVTKRFKTKCAVVNGTLNDKERYIQAYDLFQENNEYKVLVMTNAGNEGISLSKCKYLIEYDLADSYAMQTQRHGRVRRANSVSRTSYIYQLIMKGETWDNVAQKIIEKKRNYDQEIIKNL